MGWAIFCVLLFVWVLSVRVLRHRRHCLLQNICNAALSETDATRRQTLVWFAHYLLTSLELNFEVKTAMSFRGLLATCVPFGMPLLLPLSIAWQVRNSIYFQRASRDRRVPAQCETALR